MNGLCKALFLGMLLGGSVATPADEVADRAEFNIEYKASQELMAGGKLSKARDHARRAYELGSILYGPTNKNTANLAINYAKCLLNESNQEEAAPLLKSALDILEKEYGENAKELIDPLVDLGNATAKWHDSRPQRKQFDRALDIAKSTEGPDSDLYIRLLIESGARILRETGTDDGFRYIKQARKILEEHPAADRELAGLAEFNMAKHYLGLGKLTAAEEYFLSALEYFSNPEQPNTQLELATHAFLVEVYERRDEPDAATGHCLAIGRMTPFTSTQDFMPLFRKNPDYPSADLRKGHEGWVQLEFNVDESGMVDAPRVVQSDGGSTFEEAALGAIGGWRYAPRFVDGKPVATTGVKTILNFKIER